MTGGGRGAPARGGYARGRGRNARPELGFRLPDWIPPAGWQQYGFHPPIRIGSERQYAWEAMGMVPPMRIEHLATYNWRQHNLHAPVRIGEERAFATSLWK